MHSEQGTVLIVDDDQGVREALSLLLGSAGYATLAFASGQEFLQAQLPEHPSCILLDLRMPHMDGLEMQERLREAGSDIPVIFLTAKASVPAAVRAMKDGAADFIEKPGLQRSRLLPLVQEMIQRHRATMERHAREAALNARIRRLSPREADVARLAAEGKPNKVIAVELGISERTVEVHRGRVMRKLELASAAQLARLASCLSHTRGRST
ncbi:MAG: response regulator transcription factor [Ectothiorhodospiraceae bacterium]|nr:response regulator transcription factor [Ectothiorhodospiraceae bacterium]MCH8505047.1 response regulator [Ectothiorhodospiraceae bacterium]